jgi:very-short-patch-repair endonuclease
MVQSNGIELADGSPQSPAFDIKASVVARLNFAFHQNSVPAIAEIELINRSEQDWSDIAALVTSTPEFLQPKIFRFDRLKAGATERLNPVSVELDAKFLLGITEAVRGEITLEARADDRALAKLIAPCQILSPNEWTGLETAPELIAAFVRPNDPSIDAILRNAAEKLRQAGRNPALEGYKTRTKARAWELAEAMWAALVDERIVYALPPQSFERNGQKVRSPSALLERKIGTCLDLTLLFAACLEQAGLNPLIGFCESHAFCGVWLTNDEFSLGVVDEAQTLRKRMQLDELILIETTLLTNQPPVRFRAAVEKATALVAEGAEKRFELVVDVRRARHRQIKPLTLGADPTAASVSVSATMGISATLETTPRFVEELTIEQEPEESFDRLERWKRKLLDLSLRNKLLNFKVGKNAVSLLCHDAGVLEDKLAAGAKLKLLPAANVMSGADPRNAELHFRQEGENAALRYAEDALVRGDIHTNLADEELEARLTEIYRSARSSFEEGGANSLHLAIGFVSWTPQGKDQRYKAPLILMPVALERRTIRSGFRLVRHDDDARINPTLLQMLRQDFKLIIPEFERDLPAQASGVDVAQIWRIARSHFKDVKGFELTEEVVLSNFSFVKYLMWKDLVDRTEVLKRNPVVRHLIDTPKESYGDPSDMPDERSLDEDVDPQSLFMPLLADSSQTAAVVAAAGGKDYVLFGPPGSGKSQTIANMIVQLMGDAKTVLFVSQKTTALEVVRRRLNEVGLGSFCLEVHSTKAQKNIVLSQLKNAWESRAADAAHEWNDATTDLKKLRDQLNAVVFALHRRHRNGMTAHQALGRVIAGRSFASGIVLPFASADQHDEAAMRRMREGCRVLKIALDAVGDPSVHPLRGIGSQTWSPVWQNELVTAVAHFRSAGLALARSCSDMARFFGTPASGDPRWIRSFLKFALLLFKAEAASASTLLTQSSHSLRESFAAWTADKVKCAELESLLSARYPEGVMAVDLVALLGEWRDAATANFLVRNGRKKRVWDALASFTDKPMPEDCGSEIAGLIELKATRERADRHNAVLEDLGPAWRGLSTSPDQIQALFDWEDSARAAAAPLGTAERPSKLWLDALASILRSRRSELSETGQIHVTAVQFAKGFKAFEAGRSALTKLAEPDDEWFGAPMDSQCLIAAANIAERWSRAAHQTQRWCAWRAAARTATELGLRPLIAALSSGAISSQEIGTAFELGYARWWIEQVVHRDETLRSFVVEQHEDAISRYSELDEQVARLARRVVAGKLSGNIPPRSAFGRDPEFGTLSHEIEKRARHLPLRRLFDKMPTALTKLTPCVMMSPLSIAQFLPADAKPFDVVIFDEASQIPVWDAIGAIARGRQVIVVGDPKQLPPTAFFDRSDDGYDDATDLEDLDSILDECLGANIPHKRLAWHYRSRHESLIAFSNERYYEGRLITFPSPVTDDRAVRYVNVPGGVYERGGGRVNREEARAVVSDVLRRLSHPTFAAEQRSIGIVTFNTEQQRLIENLLDQERRSQPELERFFGSEWPEPVFVKNLESVQGDERDIILFSVGYGPDAGGRVSQNFGPLNKDGGARRLNVAITRARSELVVFATLKPDQIDLSRTKALGVRDFKHFLEYAQRGPRALAEAAAPLDRDTDSPFEDAVRLALEKRGWVVHPQVGVSGFRIDLGIVQPDAPGRYLAGVECDGATYHRSATARDRDRLREQVLRGLGWRIYRVWSTDWWIDADRAISKLHEKLTADMALERQAAEERAARDKEMTAESAVNSLSPVKGLLEEPPNFENSANLFSPVEPNKSAEPVRHYADRTWVGDLTPSQLGTTGVRHKKYEVVNFEAAGFTPDRNAFYDISYRPILRRMAAHVIATEGPIFDDLLVHRIARAHNFGRAAGRIRETVLDVVERRFPVSNEEGRKIFWPEGAKCSELPAFRTASLEDRDHTDIPLGELAALARRFVDLGAEPVEAAVLIAQELGLGRLREAARERFEAAARLSQQSSPG